MWVLVQNNEIEKIFSYPKGFILNSNQYSKDVFTKWSLEEKKTIGIYEVVFDNSNYKDEKWYINTNQSFKFVEGVVTASFGNATPKVIEDLKIKLIKTIKKQAGELLTPTDWCIIKASEIVSYSVPTDITTFRTSVRTRLNEMKIAITNATDTAALEALHTYTIVDGVQSRPLGELPILES